MTPKTANGRRGRRKEALAWAAHEAERVIASSKGQRRATRRNNLRLARIANRRAAEARRIETRLFDLTASAVLGIDGARALRSVLKRKLEALMTEAERETRRDAAVAKAAQS